MITQSKLYPKDTVIRKHGYDYVVVFDESDSHRIVDKLEDSVLISVLCLTVSQLTYLQYDPEFTI